MSWFAKHGDVQDYFNEFIKWRGLDLHLESLPVPEKEQVEKSCRVTHHPSLHISEKGKEVSRLVLTNQPTSNTCVEVCSNGRSCDFAKSTYCKVEKYHFDPNFYGIFKRFMSFGWQYDSKIDEVITLIGEKRVRYFQSYVYKRALRDWDNAGREYRKKEKHPEQVLNGANEDKRHFIKETLLTIPDTLADPWSRFMSEKKKTMSLEELIVKKGENYA